MKTWWLYLLECERERLYAGIALDVSARFELHLTGKGAKFTRANRPKRLLAAQPFESRGDALRAEYALKQLKRPEKLRWALTWQANIARLSGARTKNAGSKIRMELATKSTRKKNK